MNNNECLRDKTGSCGSCNIVVIALRRAPGLHDRDGLRQIAKETARDCCPNGIQTTEPLLDALKIVRPTQSIW